MTGYPRELTADEKELLLSVLPENSRGYREYRDHIGSMVALAEGRRGPGNIVLGYAGDIADNTSPLASVVAYGMIETTENTISVTVREFVGKQIDVEIVRDRRESVNGQEPRRWTYSTWAPGVPSPWSDDPVRQVRIDDNHVLAVARSERRIWVWDRPRAMNLLVPITNFYNDLMLIKGIRDPAIALHSSRFFADLDSYSDNDVRAAFIAYNAVRPKVQLTLPQALPEDSGLIGLFRNLFARKK